MTASRTARAAAVMAALALSATSCATQDLGPKTAPVITTPSASASATGQGGKFAQYYGQQLAWTPCADGLECTTIKVPLDWSDPKSRAIELAMNRKAASDTSGRLGSLLLNPGGPGGSGTSYLEYAVSFIGKSVQKRYDLVGFDPRGVERSAAVTCLNDAQMDDFRAYSFPPTPQGIEKGIEVATSFGVSCSSKTGDLLGYVDTMSAVKDLDVMRAVLGDEKLNYLGYSYGTYLGAHYAQQFPERVGRFVLDGAMDPSLTSAQLSLGQAKAFEQELRAYIEDCQGGRGCPFTGTVDQGMAQIRGLLERTLASPLKTSTSRNLTESLAFSGIIGPMYENDYWPTLTTALEAALGDNDGTGLLTIADAFADRDPSGHYTTNSTEANIAINCLDYPERPTMDEMAVQAAALAKEAPTLGPTMGYGDVSCLNWPVPATGRPMKINAKGAPAIVVIGTTHDPATPYQWARSLVAQLDKAVLVTYRGHGHTAYGRSNACISNAVEDYFAKGDLPKDGLTC